MTVYGPATGNYSRDSISKAKKSNGSSGTRIVDNDNDARDGDLVRNSGGGYHVYGSGNGATSGVSTNANLVKSNAMGSNVAVGNTGNVKSSGNTAVTQNSGNGANLLDFDSQGLYDSTLNAKNALIKQNYNSYMNTLQNNYDSTRSDYSLQENKVNSNYDDSVDQIHDQTYQGAEADKILSAQRGVSQSEQGLASRQNVVRFGNDSVNSATKQRNEMLNEIASKIATLTKAYGSDKATAQTNLGLGKTQALNEAQTMKLQTDLQVGEFNTNAMNTFDLQSNSFKQEEKMFGLQSALSLQIARMQEAGANARAAAGASLAREQFEWQKGQLTKQETEAKKDNVYKLKLAMLQADPNFNPSAKTTAWDKLTHGSNYVNPATKINQEIARLTAEYGELGDADFLNKYLNNTSYTKGAQNVSQFSDWLQSIPESRRKYMQENIKGSW